MSKNDDMLRKYGPRVADPLRLLKVEDVNHKPDVFCVGPKHVAHASDHCCGMLGEETLRAIPCAHCRQPYAAHEHDTVLMLQLTRDAAKAEVQAALKPLCEDMERDGLAGFAFVESPEKFRVA
jgi:hypothetical protein